MATIVGAGIDTFWMAELPAPVQVGVVVRLLATADELGPDHDHTMRNVIRGTDGEPLGDGEEATFQMGTVEEVGAARKDWLNGIAVITMAAFEATEAGTYTFELVGTARASPRPCMWCVASRERPPRSRRVSGDTGRCASR